jgi:hypothetical protein
LIARSFGFIGRTFPQLRKHGCPGQLSFPRRMSVIVPLFIAGSRDAQEDEHSTIQPHHVLVSKPN